MGPIFYVRYSTLFVGRWRECGTELRAVAVYAVTVRSANHLTKPHPLGNLYGLSQDGGREEFAKSLRRRTR
jgi:hypothetical protein